MADTYTTSNRVEKMEPGQYLDTWGARMNGNVIDLIDASLDGVEGYALSGSKTLTNNNGAADEARKRIQNVTGGTGGTITIPNVEKWYLVRNNSSSDVTFTTGSGTTATVKSGAIVPIFCDGANAVYQAIRPDFGTATASAAGFLANGATAGIGYTTGSGGTVTQATSKSTGVTLNKLNGVITMNGAALASGATVSFLFNNSTIGVADNLVLNISGGEVAAASYNLWASNVASGICRISLKNVSGGSLSEALGLVFTVLKGATS